ncbi:MULTISPECIES: hypothetical protein [unclassified Curtobacterium]|uniref:hypothetical protein n=1 Tax=unclassified Curtobacterium TaxID=257496 RepID=UPI0014959367|nr:MULTISPECIES: hypothetical protein [unclassified Curtobacterium]WIB00836.1 hypothetical protein QOL15_03840 [Curtobacterium sp. MCBA15_012]
MLIPGFIPVVLVVTFILIGTAVWGSFKKGPTQRRQDSEARDRRAQHTGDQP